MSFHLCYPPPRPPALLRVQVHQNTTLRLRRIWTQGLVTVYRREAKRLWAGEIGRHHEGP